MESISKERPSRISSMNISSLPPGRCVPSDSERAKGVAALPCLPRSDRGHFASLPRLHADVVPPLVFPEVLEGLCVLRADVPEDPVVKALLPEQNLALLLLPESQLHAGAGVGLAVEPLNLAFAPTAL